MWTGAHQMGKFPYGQVKLRDFLGFAHRVSWEITNRCEVPDGKLVLHRCDRPACVEPGHLFIGTDRDNAQDALSKGRWPIGEQSGRAKMTNSMALDAKRRILSGESSGSIARSLGVTTRAISLIKQGKNWRHLPWPSLS